MTDPDILRYRQAKLSRPQLDTIAPVSHDWPTVFDKSTWPEDVELPKTIQWNQANNTPDDLEPDE